MFVRQRIAKQLHTHTHTETHTQFGGGAAKSESTAGEDDKMTGSSKAGKEFLIKAIIRSSEIWQNTTL